jgi:hypothetical protein
MTTSIPVESVRMRRIGPLLVVGFAVLGGPTVAFAQDTTSTKPKPPAATAPAAKPWYERISIRG